MNNIFYVYKKDDDLTHHGILGQKWGERNGPPYPLSGGSYTKIEKEKIYRKRKDPNSIYNKKHFDEVLKKDKTKLRTLSYDPNRTKNTEMFYASHTKLDNHQYNALLNKPIPKTIYDDNGKKIGNGLMYKYAISNDLKSDIKVASEDSASKLFSELYEKDRDFYNFVTDPDRMQKYFVDDKYKFSGYRQARKTLDKMRTKQDYIPTDKDLKTVYRMFNYVLPYDGGGSDSRGASDVYNQRTKFFKTLKDNGYGACLDTNDAIYGGFKASSPVIVFDMEKIIPDKIKETKASDVAIGSAALTVRKLLGI